MPEPTKTLFPLDAEVPIPRPSEREDWEVNQAATDREWQLLLAHYGGIVALPSVELIRFHKKWYYASGHKHLGKLYNEQAKLLGL